MNFCGNFLHWEDRNGNQYGYYTKRDQNRKFLAEIRKWTGDLKKSRTFSKRNMARQWAYKKYRKANKHQAEVIIARQKRKETREDQKPKFTKEEQTLISAMKAKSHFESLEHKCNRKIKSLNTRKKTYQKKIKYYDKKIKTITNQQKLKLNRGQA